MPYSVGSEGSNGCSGFPVVDDKGKVMGCHPTKENANQQVQALYAAGAAKKFLTALAEELKKGDITPSASVMETGTPNPGYQGCGCPTCQELNCDCEHCPVCRAEDAVPETENEMENSGMDKKDYSTAQRERMAEENTAMPDGSFPIANATDLRNAIQSVGRAKDYNAAKQHIMRRARALGLTDQLPEDWKNSARKGMTGWGGSIFDLNPFVK